MGLFDKLKGWLGFTETERVQMDRRAFLKGMAVTSAGVLVPGAAVFDMARVEPGVVVPVEVPHLVELIQAQAAEDIRVYMNGILMRGGSDYEIEHGETSFQVHPESGLVLPNDVVMVDYTARLEPNPANPEPDRRIRFFSELPVGTEKHFNTQFVTV